MSHLDDEMDTTEEFERKDTSKKLPIGFTILFLGLILWGIYYLYAYTPIFSGWTQINAYEESLKK